MELMKQIADWSPSSDIRVLAVDGEDGGSGKNLVSPQRAQEQAQGVTAARAGALEKGLVLEVPD
jgi:hypothetical protein